MVSEAAIETYRRFLHLLDKHAPSMPEYRYRNLLDWGEVKPILLARDELARAVLASAEQIELQQLDDLLIKHYLPIRSALIGMDHVTHSHARIHWWWHLAEGPQVREQALKAS